MDGYNSYKTYKRHSDKQEKERLRQIRNNNRRVIKEKYKQCLDGIQDDSCYETNNCFDVYISDMEKYVWSLENY